MRSVCSNAKSRWILLASAALLVAVAAGAQEPAPDSAPPPMLGPMRGPGFGSGPFGERMELLGFGGMHGGKIVTGAPFSAVATAETKQTLADGTTIARKIQTNLFRDTQGRVRKEVTMPTGGPMAANSASHSFVFIQDPVSGSAFMLNPEQKIARKWPQHAHGTPNADSADGKKPSRENDASVKKESLGTQTINGVTAQGTRFTRTIPAGQIGNDKPLTIVKEEWYSPDLQIVVQSHHSDPFMGDTTYTVGNIKRTAPNTSLFSVPSDYTVKDEPAGPGGKRHGHRAGQAPPPTDSSGPGM